MSMGNYTEEQLIEGCRKGKPAFQALLYEQYKGKMMSICLRYARSSMEAEDIFQEAFVKVFTHIKQYKGGSFAGWVKRIFVNHAITEYHRGKRQEQTYDLDEVRDLSDDSMHVMSDLSAQEILVLINELAEGYRVVFNLFVVEGYKHEEISALLGITVGTSKSQLSKARSILKEKFKTHKISRYGS